MADLWQSHVLCGLGYSGCISHCTSTRAKQLYLQRSRTSGGVSLPGVCIVQGTPKEESQRSKTIPSMLEPTATMTFPRTRCDCAREGGAWVGLILGNLGYNKFTT